MNKIHKIKGMNMNNKIRHICNDKNGVSSIIETVIAIAIIFTILALFFSSVNNLFSVHVRTDVDLQAKCHDICKTFISSPGLNDTFSMNWEGGDDSPGRIGLGATPTISYGTFHKPGSDFVFEPEYDFFTDNMSVFGSIVPSCFLAGTQIVTADCSYKNIEGVEVGDVVKSFDTETGDIADRRVVNVFHHSPDEMTDHYLVINDFLKVTPNHLIYHDDQWILFDQVNVGDVINDVPIHSVEKVFEKVPTFDLEVEKNHNYFVRFCDDQFLVHNDEPDIDWNTWVPTSKDAYFPDIESFAAIYNRYYVEYTYVTPGVPNDGGLYEVKGESNYPYPILDSEKIDRLKDTSYQDVKTALGIGEESDYDLYDFNINIRSVNYSDPSYSYGALYMFADAVVSVTRNVLIYHPPEYDGGAYNEFIPPYYEGGQITVRMFLAGFS